MAALKLVHVVSVLGVLLVLTGLYESWQSQQSMQALLFGMGGTFQAAVEYAVTDGVTSTATASDTATATASDTATATASDTSTNKKNTQKRNRTFYVPSLLRTHTKPKQHLAPHVQRTAESTSSSQQQQQQLQQQHTNNNNNNSNDDDKDSHQKKEPLNIVLLYADDWTMKTLGTLNPVVKTPVLDTLAAEGMLFTNNCVTTSICWISRATLVTGQTAGTHGHLKISQQVLFQDNKWNQTLYPTLKQHGYWTGFVGKWHAPSPPEHMAYSFDVKNFYYGRHWETRNGVQRHVTELNQHDAIQFLRQRPNKQQKFALTVSFFATHAWDGQPYPDQYQPMPMSEAWYPNATTVIPNPVTNTQQHWDDLPWFFDERNEGRGRWRNRYDVPERYQVSMKNYYRMASEVDHACGEIIKELKDQGVYDNTLIIFTTDNGVSTDAFGTRVCACVHVCVCVCAESNRSLCCAVPIILYCRRKSHCSLLSLFLVAYHIICSIQCIVTQSLLLLL
jgi:hypothetical protein